MHEAASEDPGSGLSGEEFSALTLKALDGAASAEEIRLLEGELRRSADGARRREYVALARLRGTLGEALGIAVEEDGLDLLPDEPPRADGGTVRTSRVRGLRPSRRMARRARAHPRHPALVPAGLAAAALLAATACLVLFPNPRVPRSRHLGSSAGDAPGRVREGSAEIPEGAGGGGPPPSAPDLERVAQASEAADGDRPWAVRRDDPGSAGLPAGDRRVHPLASGESGLNESAPAPSLGTAADSRSDRTAVLKPAAHVARVDRIEGDVELLVGSFLAGSSERHPLKAGDEVPPHAGIETLGSLSGVRLIFADGTAIEMGGGSKVVQIAEAEAAAAESGKRVTILHGSLSASVAKQPPDSPMIFITPHGQARVLGTWLKLGVDPGPGGQTRLEVDEGLVRFTRTLDGRSALVGAGYSILAGAAAGPLIPLPKSSDEILLRAQDATLVGNDWGVVRDEKSSAGLVLDSPRGTMRAESVARSTSYASFLVPVDAGKDYAVWIRGACVWRNNARFQHDAVAIVSRDGRFSRTNLTRPADLTAYLFNGWGEERGEREATYFWLGGDGSADMVTLRFAQSGLATVSLHAMEGPMRVEAIWLSTSQKTLPSPEVQGPPAGRR